MHIVDESFMMDIIEDFCDIHENCREDISLFSDLMDAFR